MSKLVLRDAGIRIAGLDHSNYVHSVSVASEREELDFTGLSTAPYRETYPGIEHLTIELEMFAGNTAVDQTLRDSRQTGLALAVEVLPHNVVAAPTNPLWAADCIVTHYVGLAGDVGTATMSTVTFESNGYEVLTTPLTYPSLSLYPSPVVLPR